jgi:hypothetical protein
MDLFQEGIWKKCRGCVRVPLEVVCTVQYCTVCTWCLIYFLQEGTISESRVGSVYCVRVFFEYSELDICCSCFRSDLETKMAVCEGLLFYSKFSCVCSSSFRRVSGGTVDSVWGCLFRFIEIYLIVDWVPLGKYLDSVGSVWGFLFRFIEIYLIFYGVP